MTASVPPSSGAASAETAASAEKAGPVGRAVSHESAALHVTGRAQYVEDLATRAARLVHAWPVLAPHDHARVLEIDARAALECPGVVGWLGAADVLGENDVGPVRHDEPLFPSEICYHGQPVVWVLGESSEHARVAAERVLVRYEVLPAVRTLLQAIREDSYLAPAERLERGNAESALGAASRRLEGELFVNGQEHFYLETQAALALSDDQEGMLVHSSTQHPSETQEIVARVLGVPRHAITVQCLRMGGAFGGKETQANAWAAIAALATKKTRRPTLVRLTRQQDMRLTGKRHPALGRFRVGFDVRGVVSALDLELFLDGGFSLDLSLPVLMRALFHADNCYRVPNLRVVGRVCRTHRVSHTAFRGFGGPQGMLMIEEVLDRVARTLELPPHVVRERNFYREGDRTHYGQIVKDADRITRIWHELMASSDFEERWSATQQFNASNPHYKRGLAITPVKFGISFTATFFNQAGALVLVYRDGSVQVNHGGTEMGQGLHTKIQQIAAQVLGLPLTSIRMMATRTDKVPNTSATAASSGSDLNGAAVKNACETLKERLAEVAARRLGVAASEVVFDQGRVFPCMDSNHAVSFAELVEQAYLERIPLSATGYYKTPRIHFDRETRQGKPFHYFAYGAAVSEVEVNGFTGQYTLLRSDILHDVGDSLSPLVDRGQIEGGFIQGIGWLTTEELVWSSEGEFLSSGASTYKLPSAHECPAVLNVSLLERAAEPDVVFGSKAVGEPPFMLAFSVREALRAAAAAFGDKGVVELGAPATPEAVFWAIQRARENASAGAGDAQSEPACRADSALEA